MTELEGQVAVVTGGTRGIGHASAVALAREGAAVVACGLPDSVDEAAEAFAARAVQVTCLGCDVTRPDEVTRVIEAAHATRDRLDILVNSAGIQRYGSVVDTPEDVWHEVLATNVTSVFLACQAAIPRMRTTGGGAIVNVSSVQAIAAEAGAAAYAASKGAVNALTRALAVDHAHDGIRANSVCPGSVDTPMLRWAAAREAGEQQADDVLARWGERHLIGRVAEAGEIAQAVCFLAGPRSSFVTGSTLVVDGGLLAALSTPKEARRG
jgi:NAD(P)-dependent dehydrogenase (short-subunit alcohol dehydrogenase family)